MCVPTNFMRVSTPSKGTHFAKEAVATVAALASNKTGCRGAVGVELLLELAEVALARALLVA
jgi:hypothetical protein